MEANITIPKTIDAMAEQLARLHLNGQDNPQLGFALRQAHAEAHKAQAYRLVAEDKLKRAASRNGA